MPVEKQTITISDIDYQPQNKVKNVNVDYQDISKTVSDEKEKKLSRIKSLTNDSKELNIDDIDAPKKNAAVDTTKSTNEDVPNPLEIPQTIDKTLIASKHLEQLKKAKSDNELDTPYILDKFEKALNFEFNMQIFSKDIKSLREEVVDKNLTEYKGFIESKEKSSSKNENNIKKEFLKYNHSNLDRDVKELLNIREELKEPRRENIKKLVEEFDETKGNKEIDKEIQSNKSKINMLDSYNTCKEEMLKQIDIPEGVKITKIIVQQDNNVTSFEFRLDNDKIFNFEVKENETAPKLVEKKLDIPMDVLNKPAIKEAEINTEKAKFSKHIEKGEQLKERYKELNQDHKLETKANKLESKQKDKAEPTVKPKLASKEL